jgi:hypothetical protein
MGKSKKRQPSTAATYVSGVRETPTLGQILYWSQTESTAAGVLIDCLSSHLPRPSGPTPYYFLRQKRGKSERFETECGNGTTLKDDSAFACAGHMDPNAPAEPAKA